MMQKLAVISFSLWMGALSLPAAAEVLPFPAQQRVLNKISYQSTVEKWATTNTARVTINMDAMLDKVGLSNINNYVVANLNKIAADAGWHVTQFNRSQDKSGLETLHVEAEARLPQTALAGLRDKAKGISKSGETYTVGDIDFAPDLQEVEKTHAAARADIYAQVKEEIARLNALYPDQHYFLHQLDFIPQPVAMMNKMQMMAVGSNMAQPEASPPMSISVNAKVVETAQAIIAAEVSAKNP